MVTTEPSTRNLRERNRIDQRKVSATVAVMERLEVYGVLVVTDPNDAGSIPTRRRCAAQIVEAVLAIMKGHSHE